MTGPRADHRRPDIQGVRALAVIVVIAFHAGLPVPGGFVGVDIFFVISGFVITANEPIRANDPANGTFACKASGYSSRWSITITQFPMSNSISSGTGLRVLFPKDNASSDTYQTAWGSPVTTDVNGMLIVVP
jgi:hypothetical protein